MSSRENIEGCYWARSGCSCTWKAESYHSDLVTNRESKWGSLRCSRCGLSNVLHHCDKVSLLLHSIHLVIWPWLQEGWNIIVRKPCCNGAGRCRDYTWITADHLIKERAYVLEALQGTFTSRVFQRKRLSYEEQLSRSQAFTEWDGRKYHQISSASGGKMWWEVGQHRMGDWWSAWRRWVEGPISILCL